MEEPYNASDIGKAGFQKSTSIVGVEGGKIVTTVFDTAKYVLECKGTLSTMKLQKLCYYSQAWSLVWDNAPLFEEDFEAWLT